MRELIPVFFNAQESETQKRKQIQKAFEKLKIIIHS
jgi:hypothetical protein